MSRIAMSTLQQILALTSRLDARLPKQFTSTASDLVALQEKAHSYARNAQHVSVPQSILDSLAAGDDPYDDPIVHEALMHAEVARHTTQVETALEGRANDFLANTAVDVLGALKPCVTKVGKTLTKAVERFGSVPLEDTKSIISQGGDAASLWAEAQGAERTLQQVLAVRAYLASVPGSSVRNAAQYRVLTIAEVPPEEFVADQVGGTMPTGYAITQRGWTLSLATPDQLEARIAAVLGQIDRVNRDHTGSFQREYRRTHGIGVA